MKFFLATILLLISINVSAHTIKAVKYDGLVHISESVALRMLDFETGIEIKTLKYNTLKSMSKPEALQMLKIETTSNVKTISYDGSIKVLSKAEVLDMLNSQDSETIKAIIYDGHIRILPESKTLKMFEFEVRDEAKDIDYNGLVHMTKLEALDMLGFEVNDEQLDKSIKTYFKQGYFKEIWVDIKDEILTYYFKEKALISQIAMKGWKDNDNEIIDTVVQVKIGTLYDNRKLEAAKNRIIDALSAEGKIDSVVEIEKEELENGSVKVTFLVHEGEEIVIENQVYDGVSKLDVDEFDNVVANKEKEYIGWFWGRNDGVMKLDNLAYDSLRIRDLYMQKGYLDANVEEPFVKVNFDNYTADMSYQIKEGEIYTISGVTIKQAQEVSSDTSIREFIKLTPGEHFNIKTFREDVDRIKTYIADLSYAFVHIVPDLKKDTKKKTVEVVFKIMPGHKVKIRDVIISGNSRTLDRIIRRELYLGPGDMYSLTDLSDSKNALGRLGFFEENSIEEKRVNDKTIDLVVKVKEAPTGNIQIGGGYGSYGGLLLSVSVDDRNIWGSGISVGLKAERSELSSNYSFNIANPKLNDTDFSGNFSIFTSDSEYNDYTVLSDGFTAGLGHKFTRHVSGYMGYGYSSNSYKFDETNSTDIDTYFYEDYAKSSVTLSAKFDNTDDYYLPRSGFMFSQSFEYAGLGADADFIKSKTNFGVYKGLENFLGFDVIARYKARVNYIKETGYLPLAERFYMGGIGSVRGYESYSISPTVADDTADDDIRRIGGEYTASNNFELSFPLIPQSKMRLVTYLDWGLIGTSKDSRDDYLTDNLSRGGFGAGVEWFSPVGPIQLMFSKPLADKENDKTAVFEFTMGQRF
jgi:outer membrane protein insertion porin family